MGNKQGFMESVSMKEKEIFLEAALEYAERGIPVLPLHSITDNGCCTCGDSNCPSPGKHPRADLVPHGLKDATTDVGIIRNWFDQSHSQRMNIGGMMGSASGNFSLDVDGPGGEDYLSDKELPETLSFRTGRGRQLLFQLPEGVIIHSKTGIVNEIDIRGEGAYVVLPPSKHALGNDYEWFLSFTDHHPVPPPEWLRLLLDPKEKSNSLLPFTQRIFIPDSAIGEFVPDVIPEGRRDSTLASIAGRLRHFGSSEEEIYIKLQEVNQEHCSPPLDESQVMKIAKSISRYEPAEPKVSPEDALNNLQENPFDQDAQHQFFDSLAPLGSIDRKRFLILAHESIYDAEGITMSEIKRDMATYLGSKEAHVDQDNLYFDPESNIEFHLDSEYYSMDEDGLFHEVKRRHLTRKPIFTTEILQDFLEGQYYVRLVSYKNGNRIEKIVANKEITNKNSIAALSQHGFPIHSNTAADMISFLTDLIYRNEDRIPLGLASTQLGWINTDVFLFSDVAISRQGEKPVHFILNDPHPRMFESKGDRNVYINFIRRLKNDLPNSYTITIFVIFATFSSFLLEPLNAPNLLIHIYLESGMGKSTLTNLCGSLFGNPKFTSTVWDSTEIFIGRRASILNGVPFLIQEASSKMNTRKGETARIIYMLSEGKTRGKANPDSSMATAPIREFRTVVISNGEISLLADNDLTGSQIRLIQFTSAFGVIDIDFIQKTENLIRDNYGLLAKDFVKKVMETDLKQFKPFRVIDPKSCTPAQKEKINHLNRVIKQLQPIFIAGCIAEELFGFGYDPTKIVSEVYDQLEKQILQSVGIVYQFMPWLRNFVFQNADKFPTEAGLQVFSGTRWGVIKGDDLLIIKSAFDGEIMKAYADSDGKLSKAILQELANKGVTERDSEGNPTRNYKNKRCVWFKDFFKDQEADDDKNEE